MGIVSFMANLWEHMCFKSGLLWTSLFSDFHAVQFFTYPINQGYGYGMNTFSIDQACLKKNAGTCHI
jgi:hypothetical protein